MREKYSILSLKEYVFHSHTYRCNHAEKDIEDYLKAAIKEGYKYYGVSDHVFLPGIVCPWIRGDYSLLDEYINEFNRCKLIHNEQIKMFLGFECEYSYSFEAYYKSLLKDKGFDYLICGQHMGFDENHVDYGYFTKEQDKQDEGLLKYRDDIVNAIKSGIFLYIAHPDLYFIYCRKVTPIYEKVTKDIIEAAIKYDVALEMNLNGLLRPKCVDGIKYLEYPCDYFWKEAAKTKVKIVYGGDFHTPKNISRDELYVKMLDLIERSNVKLANINKVWLTYQAKLKKLKLK